MKFILQIGIAGLCIAGTVVLLFLAMKNEFDFKDLEFAKYFGVLGVLAFISFVMLSQDTDIEETNPAKEKSK